MSVKGKYFWITAIVIIAAVIIVLCVSYLTKGQPSEFDGTLVRLNLEFPSLI